MCLALIAWAPAAHAHDVSYAYARVTWDARGADVQITVHKDDAALLLLVPNSDWFEQEEFAKRAGPVLADSVRRRFRIRADGHPVPLVFRFAQPDPRRRGITLGYTASDSASSHASLIEITGPVFPEVANHETFVTFVRRGPPNPGEKHTMPSRGVNELIEDVLTAQHPVLRVYSRGGIGALAVLRTFIPAGIHHIAIGPDHILFVLGLLLLGGGLARLLKIVSAFTIAHSITLTLAALGLVHVPPRLVEPGIALSIVFVAFETLRRVEHDRRAILAFGFGLVHGFGFASVLAEFGLPREALGWSLFGFNVGVEIGQACIVVVVAPLLAVLAKRSPAVHTRVVRVLAILIAAAGGFWFVQRVLGKG